MQIGDYTVKTQIGNYTVSLNKEKLIQQIINITTSIDDAYNIHGGPNSNVESWITTGDDLELAKNAGIKFVEDLTEKTIQELFQRTCCLTKKGLLPKNRRFVVENLNITIRYDNEHGCHSYSNKVLEFIDYDFDVVLQLTTKNYQSSF